MIVYETYTQMHKNTKYQLFKPLHFSVTVTFQKHTLRSYQHMEYTRSPGMTDCFDKSCLKLFLIFCIFIKLIQPLNFSVSLKCYIYDLLMCWRSYTHMSLNFPVLLHNILDFFSSKYFPHETGSIGTQNISQESPPHPPTDSFIHAYSLSSQQQWACHISKCRPESCFINYACIMMMILSAEGDLSKLKIPCFCPTGYLTHV